MKKERYFRVYDDMVTYYGKELAWQNRLLGNLKRKMKSTKYKEVDRSIAESLILTYGGKIKALKSRLKEVEEIFGSIEELDRKRYFEELLALYGKTVEYEDGSSEIVLEIDGETISEIVDRGF